MQNVIAYNKRKELKQKAVDSLGGKCEICGYNECLSALDFHHIDDFSKEFNISSKTNWDNIEGELKKCALLCCRCHREVHDGMHTGFLYSDEKEKYYID